MALRASYALRFFMKHTINLSSRSEAILRVIRNRDGHGSEDDFLTALVEHRLVNIAPIDLRLPPLPIFREAIEATQNALQTVCRLVASASPPDERRRSALTGRPS